MNIINIFKKISIICFFTAIAFFWSCGEDGESIAKYNPSKRVTLSGFYPETGGLATKFIISGDNFGADLSKIKVYFTGIIGEDGTTPVSVRAPLIGSNGDHIYGLTPRLSHMKECTISVVVGKDSVIFSDKRFIYQTLTIVTTVAGKKGTTVFRGGTLSEATFGRPHTLAVDSKGNIFVSEWGVPQTWVNPNFILISPHNNRVEALHSNTEFGAPTIDENDVVWVPTDPRDGFFTFDPELQWAPQSRQILHPSAADVDAGRKRDFNIDWKHGMTYSEYDGHIWTRGYNGQVVKFDPVTRVGELVEIIPTVASSNSYPYFDPLRPHIMYIVFNNASQIWEYDITTQERRLFAGSVRGWKDGYRTDAEFNQLTQMVVLPDGVILVADRNNHCIRQITPDGMVTTLIGKGGIAGHQDGNPEDALFDSPEGIAIGKDGSIYVADGGNNAVRRLAVE